MFCRSLEDVRVYCAVLALEGGVVAAHGHTQTFVYYPREVVVHYQYSVPHAVLRLSPRVNHCRVHLSLLKTVKLLQL